MIVRRRGEWLSARVADELVMMSVEKGNYLGLNEVGGTIWELIETPQSVDAICTRLQGDFDVAPDICRAEIDSFLKDLVQHGVVSIDEEPPP